MRRARAKSVREPTVFAAATVLLLGSLALGWLLFVVIDPVERPPPAPRVTSRPTVDVAIVRQRPRPAPARRPDTQLRRKPLPTPAPPHSAPIVPTRPAQAPVGEIETLPVEEAPREPRDWYVDMETIAGEFSDVQAFSGESFDGRPDGYGDAVARYNAAPRDSPLWDNVETDQLGRKILRAGSCYRVVQDDNVMRLEIYETFTRFLVFCDGPPEPDVPLIDLSEMNRKERDPD